MKRILQKWQECWKNLTAKHVSIAQDPDALFLLVNGEATVFVAPTLQVVPVELGTLALMVVNDLGVALTLDTYGLCGDEGLVCWELVVDLIESVHFTLECQKI